MECMNSETLDYMYITMMVLGLACGIMVGAIAADRIYKGRK